MTKQGQNNGQQINPIEAITQFQGQMNDFCFQLKNWFSQLQGQVEQQNRAAQPNVVQTPQGQFVEHNAQKK